MPKVACFALLLSIVSVSQAQQFRTPTIPSNASAGYVPQPSFEGQMHADAIRRQMIRAEREQGAPLGFAAQAYRAQQAYAAQQAYDSHMARQSQSQRGVAPQGLAANQPPRTQSAADRNHFETRSASIPAANNNNPFQSSQANFYQPPVHLPPTRMPMVYPYPVATVPQSADYVGAYSQTRQTPPMTVANEAAYYANQNQVARPSPTGLSARPQMNARPAGLQERITRAITGNQRQSRSSQTRNDRSVGRQNQPSAFVAQSQLVRPIDQRTRRGSTSDRTAVKTAKRLPKQTPARRADSPPSIRDSQVARAGDPSQSAAEMREVGNKPIRQTVMEDPIEDPFGDRLAALPQLVDEAEVYRPSGNENVLRSSKPIGRQISILNRSRDEDPDNYDPPEAPDFRQDANEFSNADRQINDQLDQQLESIEAGESQDTNDRLTTETQNSLRQQDDSELSPRSLLDSMEDDEEEETEENLLDKSCDAFRRELLDNPIRNIALDISPPASELIDPNDAVSRDWTDRMGNVVATGRIVDLRRGYVIVDGVNGRLKLATARLSDSDLEAIADYWQIPTACGVGNRGSVARCWAPQTFTWTASSLCHKTLYFENVQLERYGHSHGPFTQPIHSFGHFFVSLITVPYQSAIHPPNECNYALGFYRPGDCAPWLKDPIPISLRGAARQALVVTGLGYAL